MVVYPLHKYLFTNAYCIAGHGEFSKSMFSLMMMRTWNHVKRANFLLRQSPSSYPFMVDYFDHPKSHAFSSLASLFPGSKYDKKEESEPSTRQRDADIVISRVQIGSHPDDILRSLVLDKECECIQPSDMLVNELLFRFKDDWKSALGVFRWAGSRLNYRHTPETHDMMVDILGKMKQIDQMMALLEEMHQGHLVTLKTVGKAMRRLSGAGQWQEAVKLFDELGNFGLQKNTESMNLLLDTLCKERKVVQARAIFLELKEHISPDVRTFNILIHGWCKVNRVEEADWTIHEMKGYGHSPCVVSYSTIIQQYCRQNNFLKAIELLDSMEAQGGLANATTYTTIMCSLARSGDLNEALQMAERMKKVGCKPDTLFYNSFIHTIGKAGRTTEAVRVFQVEMPSIGVSPNTSTYNTMIAMFCHQGQDENAMKLLEEMESSMVCKPDCQTYYPLLKSCIRTGKIDSLLRILLDDMVKKHHLSLDVSAYMLLIHGLCRANKCQWAYSLFEELISKDMKPKYSTCRLLLEEVKLKNMHDAANKIETFMKRL